MDASEGDLARRLVGVWDLVSSVELHPDGRTTYPLGEDARGQIVYTADGRMSAQLTRAHRPRFASDDPRASTVTEREEAFTGYFAYFGSYIVDPTAGVVVHRIEGASFPNLVGAELARSAVLEGDRLTLSADTAWGRVVNASCGAREPDRPRRRQGTSTAGFTSTFCSILAAQQEAHG